MARLIRKTAKVSGSGGGKINVRCVMLPPNLSGPVMSQPGKQFSADHGDCCICHDLRRYSTGRVGQLLLQLFHFDPRFWAYFPPSA